MKRIEDEQTISGPAARSPEPGERLAITVPDIGLESEEIKFGSWLKLVGEAVAPGEDLFEIEADKATVVCESMAGGTLAEITVTGGDVRTGDVIGWLDAG